MHETKKTIGRSIALNTRIMTETSINLGNKIFLQNIFSTIIGFYYFSTIIGFYFSRLETERFEI